MVSFLTEIMYAFCKQPTHSSYRKDGIDFGSAYLCVLYPQSFRYVPRTSSIIARTCGRRFSTQTRTSYLFEEPVAREPPPSSAVSPPVRLSKKPHNPPMVSDVASSFTGSYHNSVSSVREEYGEYAIPMRVSPPLSNTPFTPPTSNTRFSSPTLKPKSTLHIPSLSEAVSSLQLSPVDEAFFSPARRTREGKRDSAETPHSHNSRDSMPSPQDSPQSPVGVSSVDHASQRNLIGEDKTRCRFAEVSRSGERSA